MEATVAEERIKDIEKQLGAMEDYMHILTHDLRTPLSNIISFSGLFLEGSFSQEESKEIVKIINKKSLEMLEMMESCLALEKAERGQARLVLKQKTVSDILSKINKIFSEIKNNGNAINVVLKNPQNDFLNLEIVNKIVLVDKHLFFSMITNLLKNATEALSSEKTNERVTVNLFEDNNLFCVSVSNPGEVPEEFRKNLFQKFYTSKKTGTGLGLYGAKLIAEAHGGTLNYEPFPGGTRFTVRIPLQICS